MTAQRRTIGQLAVFTALLISAAGIRADLDTARQAYVRDNYAVAAREFRKAAELGHPEAQFNLGALYYKGQGLKRDPALAFAWIYLAAENGYPETRLVLEQIRPELKENAAALIQELRGRYGRTAIENRLLPAASSGAAPEVIASPEEFSGRKPEFQARRPSCKPLAALARVENFSSHQFAVAKGFGLLVLSIRFAADGSARDIDAILSYPGELFDRDQYRCWIGLKFPQSTQLAGSRQVQIASWTGSDAESRAAALMRMSEQILPCAEAGSPACQHLAALLPFENKNLGMTDQTALLRAAQGGFGPAQYAYAQSLIGLGGAVNRERARSWFEVALDNGVDSAGVALARMEITDRSTPNWAKARELLEAAQRKKNPKAVVPLASLLAAAPDAALRAPDSIGDLLERGRLLRGAEDPNLFEIEAAAAAARGDFKAALRAQGNALQSARDLGWNLAPLEKRQAAYYAGQPWFGDLLAY